VSSLSPTLMYRQPLNALDVLGQLKDGGVGLHMIDLDRNRDEATPVPAVGIGASRLRWALRRGPLLRRRAEAAAIFRHPRPKFEPPRLDRSRSAAVAIGCASFCPKPVARSRRMKSGRLLTRHGLVGRDVPKVARRLL
jgi:hypothetical protein